MMKKLGLFLFVLILIVAFALPAFAYSVEGAKGERFTVGGYVDLDVGWRNTDKNYNTNVAGANYAGTADATRFILFLPSSVILGSFVMGDVSANWLIATSSTTIGSNMAVPASGQNQKDNDILDYYYGTYKFGNSHIIAGKIGSNWTTFLTSASFGYNGATGSHINSIAFGGLYDNKVPTLRFGQTVNKMFSYHVALITPGTYSADTNLPYYPPYTLKNSSLSYAQFPTIAAKFTLNFGQVMVLPGMAYQQVKWDGLPAGWGNTMTSWAITVPGRVAFGPFVGVFNIAYGQNIGGFTGSVSFTSDGMYTTYQRSTTTGVIYDTKNIQGLIDLSYTFGNVTPHVFYAITHSENDMWVVGNKYHERTSMGINATIIINKNFQIIPEYAAYTYGVTPGYLNATGGKYDFGNDWLAGVKFRVLF